jgi:hypothetical protein
MLDGDNSDTNILKQWDREMVGELVEEGKQPQSYFMILRSTDKPVVVHTSYEIIPRQANGEKLGSGSSSTTGFIRTLVIIAVVGIALFSFIQLGGGKSGFGMGGGGSTAKKRNVSFLSKIKSLS